MTTKAKRHTHKYYRAQLSIGRIWACALPDCNHFMPPHYTELIESKSSICWNCGESFEMDKDRMKMDKPQCHSCSPSLDTIIQKELETTESTSHSPFTKTPIHKPIAPTQPTISVKLAEDMPMCKQCGTWRASPSNTEDLCLMCFTNNITIKGSK